MEAFTYKGISDGKYVEGNIEAINQEEASHKLKEQKIIITNLNRTKKKKSDAKTTKSKGGGFSFGKKKVKVEDILIFSKQFATMVKAGLPILEVLGMLRDQLESPAIKEVAPLSSSVISNILDVQFGLPPRVESTTVQVPP